MIPEETTLLVVVQEVIKKVNIINRLINEKKVVLCFISIIHLSIIISIRLQIPYIYDNKNTILNLLVAVDMQKSMETAKRLGCWQESKAAIPIIMIMMLNIIMVTTHLIRKKPEVYGATPEGHGMRPEGHNVRPEGHNVRPEGHNMRPEGYNVRPEGYNVRPEGHSLKPLGHSLRPLGNNV
jgi:hypothetical protein